MHLPQQKNVRASLTAAGISGCWLSLCLYASARLPVPSPLLNLLLNPLQLLLQNLLQPLSLKSLALHALSRLNRVLPQPQHLQNNLRRQAQLQQQLSRLQSNPRRQAQLQQQLSRLQSNPHRQAQLHLAELLQNLQKQLQLSPASAWSAATLSERTPVQLQQQLSRLNRVLPQPQHQQNNPHKHSLLQSNPPQHSLQQRQHQNQPRQPVA